jgi:type IV secretion system protein VirB3
MSAGSLQTDPLFVGLTRPTLFLGVSLYFCLLNGLTCMMYFIMSSNLQAFLILPFVHLIGYICCFNEPLFIELFLLRAQKCSHCKNKLYHGANSYDLY